MESRICVLLWTGHMSLALLTIQPHAPGASILSQERRAGPSVLDILFTCVQPGFMSNQYPISARIKTNENKGSPIIQANIGLKF